MLGNPYYSSQFDRFYVSPAQQPQQQNQLNPPILPYNADPYRMNQQMQQGQQQQSQQQPQQQPVQQQPYNTYIVVSAGSLDEIKGYKMENSMASYVFPMPKVGKIYIKQLGTNLTSEILEFAFVPPQPEVTQEDMIKVFQDKTAQLDDITTRVAKMEEYFASIPLKPNTDAVIPPKMTKTKGE